jgi:secreted trypsin-like serine protease
MTIVMVSSSTVATGQVSAPQIVGGLVTEPHEYPWQALLYPAYGNPRVYCGASLISATWVLTAAHCVNGYSASGLKVDLGTHVVYGSNPARQSFTLKRVIAHPDYDSGTEDYDLALLELNTPVSFVGNCGDYLPLADLHAADCPIAPIRLAGAGDSGLYTPNNANDTRCPITSMSDACPWPIVSGWGAVSSSGSTSNYLRKVAVPIVSNATCNGNYGWGSVTDRMMCAGRPQGGIDSCQGDSGGPIFINDAGVPKLLGTVSWGNGCAWANYPGVYSNVANMRGWVDSYMTQVFVPTLTPSQTRTPTQTLTPSQTLTRTATRTTTATRTLTISRTLTVSRTPTITLTPSLTITPTITLTPSMTRSATISRTPTNTLTPSLTRTMTKTRTSTKTRTNTRTATLSPTMTPKPEWMLNVGNGDFEMGHQTWDEALQNYNQQYDGLVTNDTSIKSRSGTYYAWFGGADSIGDGVYATSVISQTVTVPAGAPYLRLYYLAKSADICAKSGTNYYDYANVLVNDVVLAKIELCTTKSVNKWTPLTFNLTAYKNQSVVITIQTTNDNSLISSFWIDDVGFVPTTNYVLSYYGKANTQSQLFPVTPPVRPTVTP